MPDIRKPNSQFKIPAAPPTGRRNADHNGRIGVVHRTIEPNSALEEGCDEWSEPDPAFCPVYPVTQHHGSNRVALARYEPEQGKVPLWPDAGQVIADEPSTPDACGFIPLLTVFDLGKRDTGKLDLKGYGGVADPLRPTHQDIGGPAAVRRLGFGADLKAEIRCRLGDDRLADHMLRRLFDGAGGIRPMSEELPAA